MLPARSAPEIFQKYCLLLEGSNVFLSLVTRLQSNLTRPLAEAAHRLTLTAEGNLRLLSGEYKIYPQPDNASAFELVQRHPDRFLSWAFLNPRGNPRVLDDLEKWRSYSGMIGVKLHPHWHDYTTDAPYGFGDANHSYDYGAIRGWVERMPVTTTAEKQKIFANNFLSLI